MKERSISARTYYILLIFLFIDYSAYSQTLNQTSYFPTFIYSAEEISKIKLSDLFNSKECIKTIKFEAIDSLGKLNVIDLNVDDDIDFLPKSLIMNPGWVTIRIISAKSCTNSNLVISNQNKWLVVEDNYIRKACNDELINKILTSAKKIITTSNPDSIGYYKESINGELLIYWYSDVQIGETRNYFIYYYRRVGEVLYALEKQLSIKSNSSMICFLSILIYDKFEQLQIACLVDNYGRYVEGTIGDSSQAMVDRVIAYLTRK